jgi:hypothetical protein
MKKDVHDLNPGELAIVAIKPNATSFNALTKTHNQFGGSNVHYFLAGELWKYTLSIPHGSIVLVVSKHKVTWTFNNLSIDMYKIIYQDGIYLIKVNSLINPYFNESET